MEEVKEFLKTNYPEDKVSQMLDDEIPEWVDEDDSDYEGDDYEWYHEYCNGEAEAAVRMDIVGAVVSEFYGFLYTTEIDKLIREHDERLDV